MIFIEYKSTKSLGKIFKIRKTHKIRCSKTLILCVLSWKYLLFSEYSSKIYLILFENQIQTTLTSPCRT
ncbi:hypothetical protein CJ239_01565 [Streptococcus sp. UMB0029]|nr:hypothetical protein CJ239_01565 [Streptococcus sp. UMB0029]